LTTPAGQLHRLGDEIGKPWPPSRPGKAARPESAEERAHNEARASYWDQFCDTFDRWEPVRRYYQQRLSEVYRLAIPPGSRVLEVGCAAGDLLASLQPGFGLGIDLSARMVERARARHPHLHFLQANVNHAALDGPFDYILFSDVVNDLWDVQGAFEAIRGCCHPGTRVLVNAWSRLWELPRRVGEAMCVLREQPRQNWLTAGDVQGLLRLAGFETIRCWQEVLCPFGVPLLAPFANRYLSRIWPLNHLALTNFLIARPEPAEPRSHCRVSVVVAARNEEGNIPRIFEQVPELGAGTELIFVEGNSTDDTYGAIEREMQRTGRPDVRLLKQPGKGKGDAVRAGFAAATGDLLMILDADLTVRPEELPRFYEAWRSGKAEFVNGVRLVYPMEERAMRFFNLVGNKFFSLAFSWLLSQTIKDTLCGTKVLSREHYAVIAANRSYFGDFDPFGDFDLIFGAAKYNLRIEGLPVRYRERVYGDTNIQRWRHGVILLRMVLFALRRLKFV
jgi:SAM-dependent methyltransferase